jgi:hypothetical protein
MSASINQQQATDTASRLPKITRWAMVACIRTSSATGRGPKKTQIGTKNNRNCGNADCQIYAEAGEKTM